MFTENVIVFPSNDVSSSVRILFTIVNFVGSSFNNLKYNYQVALFQILQLNSNLKFCVNIFTQKHKHVPTQFNI